MQKVMYFDFKTTGINPATCGIVQLAARMIIDGKHVGQFEQKMRPHSTAEIQEGSWAVHGHDRDFIMGADPDNCAPNEADVFIAFKNWLNKFINPRDRSDKGWMAGYNIASYDVPILAAWFERCGDKYGPGSYFNWNVLDVRVLASWMGHWKQLPVEPDNYKQTSIARALGIPTEGAHDALVDIEICETIAYTMRCATIDKSDQLRDTVAVLSGQLDRVVKKAQAWAKVLDGEGTHVPIHQMALQDAIIGDVGEGEKTT